MNEHLSQPIIEGYRQRRLSTAELLLVDDHLTACDTCRSVLRQFEQSDPISQALLDELAAEAKLPPRHLTFAELESYIGEKLNDVERDIIANHLYVCSACNEEAQDLRAFQSTLATQAASLPDDSQVALKPTANWFERLQDWLRIPAFQFALQLAGALMIVTVAIFFLLLPARREAAELRARLGRLEQENLDLQNQTAELANLQAQLETLKQENEALHLAQPTNELPTATLALKDAGGAVTLDADGALQGLNSLSSTNQQLVKNALQNGRLILPATISEVATKAGVLMSSASPGVSFALQSPVGTFVQSPRPLFRWQRLTGATSYVVTVYDAAFRVVAKSEEITRTEWTPPNDLERGVTFRWQVTATVNGKPLKSPLPPAPEARFKVIDPAKADEVQRARQSVVNSHLASGILYAQAGLLDEAERELQELLRANPQSGVVKRLLQNLRMRRQ